MKYSYASNYRFYRENFEKSKQTNGFKGWRKAQYKAQRGHCAWCYKYTDYKDMDVDHIEPLGRAGYETDLNDFDNLVLACHECNRDLKKDSAYNEIAYKNTLEKLSKQQKQDGYAPKRIYWERPEWIGANRYSKSYRDYTPVNTLEHERNVWLMEAPLVRDYSLKINDFEYAKSVAVDRIESHTDTIWKVFKWAVIGAITAVIIFSFAQITDPKNKNTKSNYCDFSCQEAGRMRYEAEEEKKRRKEEEDYYEEARRYWECRNAGGTEYDCG